METKDVMNKIIDGTNVGAMKKELNELKCVLNSIDSTNFKFEQEVNSLSKELEQVEKAINEGKAITLANAEANYNSKKILLEQNKEIVIFQLRAAEEKFNNYSHELLMDGINDVDKMYQVIDEAKEKLVKEEKNLEEVIAKEEKLLTKNDEEYRTELSNFEQEFKNGSVFLDRTPKFFNAEDIKAINSLLNKFIKFKNKIEKAKSVALENAESNFRNINRDMRSSSIQLTRNIDLYKSAIVNTLVRLDEYNSLKSIKDNQEELYKSIITELEKVDSTYNSEVEMFEQGFVKNKIAITVFDFFLPKDIKSLNAFLEKMVEIDKVINDYNGKIENNNQERESIINQIKELEEKVQEITVAREKCIENVSEVAGKTIKSTTRVVSEVTDNVGKGLRGASVIGKFAFGSAKKQAAKAIKNLVEDTLTEKDSQKTSENPIIGGLVDGLKESELTKEDVLKAGKSLLEDAKKELLGEFSEKKPEELRDEVQDGVKKFFKQFKGYANPSADNTENDDTENEE